MRRTVALLMTLASLCLPVLPVYAQSSTAQLAARLSQEEQQLKQGTVITAEDLKKLDALLKEIRATSDQQLLSKAELLQALFRDRAGHPGRAAATSAELKALSAYRWHRVRRVIVRTGFWVGLSSLTLLGLSQATNAWASDNYAQQTTLAGAKPYFITGQVSQLTSAIGAIGAVAGLGTAWALSVNPFDVPTPPGTEAGLLAPPAGMSQSKEISYLKQDRSRLEAQQKRATTIRKVSVGFLSAGLTGTVATIVVTYLINRISGNYTTPLSASTQATLKIYNDVMIGTGALALVGLVGTTVGYTIGPDPSQIAQSITLLDAQLAALSAAQ